MKKLLLATAAVLCFAIPAKAQEWKKQTSAQQTNSYFAVRMGGSRLSIKVNEEKENKSLFVMSGAIGTTIAPDVRAELELMATDNFEKKETGVGERYAYKHGLGNLSINILKDFDAGRIKPYVGIGIGTASFTDDINYQVLGIRERRKVTTTVLNGNIQAGVAVSLTDTISLDTNARYTCFGNYEIKILGNKLKMKNNTADVSVGLRFAF